MKNKQVDLSLNIIKNLIKKLEQTQKGQKEEIIKEVNIYLEEKLELRLNSLTKQIEETKNRVTERFEKGESEVERIDKEIKEYFGNPLGKQGVKTSTNLGGIEVIASAKAGPDSINLSYPDIDELKK